jgi:hypothetical protein
MKLLTALKRRPADNCIILTYNANLLFFEHLVFEPLYAAGCRNTLVLCDPLQYRMALNDVEQLRYAGQRYLLMPARISPSGAFHPKLILLTSSDGGRLFLSSGNLTQAGYMRNWEVATLFEYNANKPDPSAWVACRWAFDALSQIVAAFGAAGLAHQRLDQLWGTTPWLRQERPLPSSAPVWPLHNLDAPLLDQVMGRYRQDDGSLVHEAIIVSPFFDANARAIARLLAECQPQRLRLYTQADTHSLNPRALAAILERHGTQFQPYELNLEGRLLHAKTLLLRTGRGVWLATGSANFSRPAWLHPAATGNTEMVVLRFETDPAYFDAWLDELVAHASPLELDWGAEPPETGPTQPTAETQLALLSAILEGRRLVLDLAERLATDATLTLFLTGGESQAIGYEQWKQGDDHKLSLPIAPRLLSWLEGPTLVSLKSSSPAGEWFSNSVLLHNLAVLRRFGRPVVRRERPSVPEGMKPESYEHCAQLLEMIHDLLATNTEQLRRHRGRIAALSETDQQEKQMIVEEEGEYNPKDHFVEEQVEAATSNGGVDLYADFYDRLTYEELLRAALAAVYRPIPEPTADIEEPMPEPVAGKTPAIPTIPPLPPPPDDEALRAQMLARIERGFKRLVGNFLQGSADDEYLDQAPPQYLMELFVIITIYLRVVWRDGMLNREPFVDHSLDLLTAFWGQPQQPGVWQTLHPRLTDDLLTHWEERLALSAQTWLHACVVAELLEQNDDRRIYDLAAWMRHLHTTPDVLAALPDDVYRRLWRASFLTRVEFRSAVEVVARLRETCQWYDEIALKVEISTWPGARAHISQGIIAEIRQTPKLDVTLPLLEADLDRCLQAFQVFLLWPKPKQIAWARFANTNPLVDADDLEWLTMFYRSDRRSLVFAARRKSGEYRPDIDVAGVTVNELSKVRSIKELHALAGI